MQQTVLMTTSQGDATPLFRQPKFMWTLVGISAVPLWALWPLFAVISTGGMPTFQFFAITYAIGALTLFGFASRRQFARQAGALRKKLWPTAMVVFGMLFSNYLFVLAAKYMPAAQANLIVYLWPVTVVILAALLRLIRLRVRHVVSIAVALTGAMVVVGPDVSGGTITGVALAGVSGLVWALFCVYRLWQGPNAPDALMTGMGASAMIAALLHFMMESTVVPEASAVLSALLNGVVPLAIGNLAWDHGMRKGDKVLLAIAAYATPLASALILVAFGFATATVGLLAGGGLIVAGGVISSRSRDADGV